MRARTPYRRGPAVTALVAVAVGALALAGCGLGGGQPVADPPPAATSSATAKPTPGARPSASRGGEADSGLPDVCELLSRGEVSSLAGNRQVVQVDNDGAAPGATNRYCQWQLAGARLAIFLNASTAGEFTQARGDRPKVTGVGDDAYVDSGHLFVHVRGRDVTIDVYATLGNDEAGGQRMAKTAALKIIDRL